MVFSKICFGLQEELSIPKHLESFFLLGKLISWSCGSPGTLFAFRFSFYFQMFDSENQSWNRFWNLHGHSKRSESNKIGEPSMKRSPSLVEVATRSGFFKNRNQNKYFCLHHLPSSKSQCQTSYSEVFKQVCAKW